MAKCKIAVVVCIMGMTAMSAVPMLKSTSEPIPSAGIKAKLLYKSEKKIQVTPAAQRWRLRRRDENGIKEWNETHYDVREIWREHEFAGEWRDLKGNSIIIANVTAPCPQFEEEHAKREDIDAKIAEDAASFKSPDDAALAKWAARFANVRIATSAISSFAFGSSNVPDARIVDLGSQTRIAAFFRTKDEQWHWVDIGLAQTPRPREGETFLKSFLKSVSPVATSKASSAAHSGGMELKGYRFESNKDDKDPKVAEFIRKANLFLLSMRDAYMRYVPPQKEIGESKVRLFMNRMTYDEHLKGMAAGEMEGRSVGLWDPSREELVILYDRREHEKKKEALNNTLKTMRHEAFHQYLFYATGGLRHALWFNEGHACFFENAKPVPGKNAVRIWDDPSDRRPAAVEKNPAKYARHVKAILGYGREKFYSGSLSAVNDNYTAAWALIYFLQKAAPSFKEFAPYSNVIPTYLKAMAEGKTWQEATREAWSHVESRNFEADFLKFWRKRNIARSYEPVGK